ncbi:GAP family protein [Corynebacterium sp.]|uniref:GAP family protein n=1 Tax=Corynebacterium sp. TaxID=1720 RepID=UPI0028B069B2|nr:GAP family protein [Corynebacterium sp.]
MDITSLGTLAVLALVDSTSFGTLLIPVWLLMTPGRLQVGRVLQFLLTVVSMYFFIGLGLLLGANALFATFSSLLETKAFLIGQFIVGLALVSLSYKMDNKNTRGQSPQPGGRISRWRARATGANSHPTGVSTSAGAVKLRTTAPLMALAVTAVLAEVATMVPYLAAIGLITAEGPGLPGNALPLAGYCLVMIAPALLLTVGRIVA